MYGILMLLPQSNAFKTLHARLHSVPTAVLLQLEDAVGADGARAKVAAARPNGRTPAKTDTLWQHIDFQPLLELFQERQVAIPSYCFLEYQFCKGERLYTHIPFPVLAFVLSRLLSYLRFSTLCLR